MPRPADGLQLPKRAAKPFSRGHQVNHDPQLFQRLLPNWTRNRVPDHRHPHRRRFTARYRRKQGIVKHIWIVSGALMILQGSAAIILALALGTTFLSFMILDETP